MTQLCVPMQAVARGYQGGTLCGPAHDYAPRTLCNSRCRRWGCGGGSGLRLIVSYNLAKAQSNSNG